MAKVKVEIKYCCCCSLTVATVLIALYTLCYYALAIVLASTGLGKTPPAGDEPFAPYTLDEQCLGAVPERTLDSGTTVVFYGASSYQCSLALYTEEMKYDADARFPILIINIIIFALLVISSILVFVTVCIKLKWLLLPWIAFACLDVLRGFGSVIMIFVYCHGDLARIAVGIFFLGIQFFHISLILVVVAKFQRMHDKSKGVDYKGELVPEKAIMADGSHIYPTVPSHYAYSNSPHLRREGYYQPNAYNTYAGAEKRAVRPRAIQYPDHPSYYGNNGYETQQSAAFGRTM